jgi:hypothetical protein
MSFDQDVTSCAFGHRDAESVLSEDMDIGNMFKQNTLLLKLNANLYRKSDGHEDMLERQTQSQIMYPEAY